MTSFDGQKNDFMRRDRKLLTSSDETEKHMG